MSARHRVESIPTKGELIQTLRLQLDEFGEHIIRAADFVDIVESYEDELRKQPSRVSYLESVKAELDRLVAIEEDHHSSWMAERRAAHYRKLLELNPKNKPTVPDLDAALDADLDALAQKQHLHFLRAQSRKLAGFLSAMHHKKSVLEQLAQTERRGLSEYSRGVHLTEEDAQRLMDSARERFLAERSS
jgi:hypothetical protein